MSTWILMVVALTNGGATVSFEHFNNMTSCQSAAQELHTMAGNAVRTKCVNQASGQAG